MAPDPTDWMSGKAAPTGSFTTGMTPFPSFPELSAISCSIQWASLAIFAYGATALSRPAMARSAIATPSA
jgi:hypothetical protein